MLVPALIYLVYLKSVGISSFLIDMPESFLLIGAGVISGLPLIIFITGARLINLSIIGVLQYIYPTLIFIVGAFVYNETLTEAKIIGLIFIWIALIVYTIEGAIYLTRKSAVVPTD